MAMLLKGEEAEEDSCAQVLHEIDQAQE